MAKDPITDCQAWTRRIPPASKVQCIFGGGDIDASEFGVFQVVWGLAERRKDGGTHALSLRQTKYEFACGTCVAKQAAGTADQGDLFA